MSDMPVSSAKPASETTDSLTSSQPIKTVTLGDTTFTLLGTAHVSQSSADEVKRFIDSGMFDAVAIELDDDRYSNLTDPDRWAKLDLFQVLRQGRAGMLAANLALSSYQERLGEQLGVKPGEEMRVAIAAAKEHALPLWLIDRNIGITLRRVYGNISWWQRLTLVGGLLTSVFSREEITEEDIESLKEGDVLEATFSEFAESSEKLFIPLITERDEFMALKLQHYDAQQDKKQVLVVIGAGHLKGLAEHLTQGQANLQARLAELNTLPKGAPWLKILPWIITLLVILGFVVGFTRSPELGWALLRNWVLINGGLAAIGTLIATAHPLTVVVTFLAAPLTSLNPLIGAGFVAAGMELWLKKPQVSDFQSLRKDITETRGWWRNRVAKTLLVFILATFGSAAGTWLAGTNIVVRLFQ